MSTKAEFFPASGADPLTWETFATAPLKLISGDGWGPITVSPLTVKTPAQAGETLLDTIVPPRVFSIAGLLQAVSSTALWTLRAAFARATSRQPVRPGETQSLGIVRISRDGYPAVELDVMVRSVSLPSLKGNVGILPNDVEFMAPYPFWREISDALLSFEASGGFAWGETGTLLEFPLEMPTNNIEQEVINAGDVDASVLIQMFGEATNVRMLNETTGETIEILVALAAGEYVEIQTAHGSKSVTKVAAGVRTDLMSALNLSNADFWSLRPGSNMVKFEADVNTSGYARIYWRQRYSGI